MSVLRGEFGLNDPQIPQMTLYTTLLIMNEAYQSLVLVPNSAPHKYLIGMKLKGIEKGTNGLNKSDSKQNIADFKILKCIKFQFTSQ